MSDYEHTCKFFIYQVKADFSPIAGSELYERKEYAYSGCNCGAASKTLIKETEDEKDTDSL